MRPRGPVGGRHREATRARPPGRVRDLHVDVGLGAVARVPAGAQVVPRGHLVADGDRDSPAPQVGEEDVRAAWREREHHVVAGDGRDPRPDPSGLTQHVGEERELRPTRRVVGLAVVHGDHRPARGCEDRGAEPAEGLGTFHPECRPPRARRGQPSLVDGHEVDRVGHAEGMGPVARHPARGAVAREPEATEGQVEQHGLGCHGDPSGRWVVRHPRSCLTLQARLTLLTPAGRSHLAQCGRGRARWTRAGPRAQSVTRAPPSACQAVTPPWRS